MAIEYPHVALAERWCKAVVAGEVPACKWVILACTRHLNDKEKSRTTRSFQWRFDKEKAERICKFVELMPHVKGHWARERSLIKLEGWQAFILCVIFGWVNKKSGLRRFRKAYIEVGRKNAKSTLAAGVGLYMQSADNEYGAEVYSGATTEKQAWEIFGTARQMALKNPHWQMRYDMQINARSLASQSFFSKFEPLIGEPGDGASPSCALVDEYHEHPTDHLVNTMETGMGARKQPLLFIITTAGDNLAGPCYATHQDIKKILEGVVEDETVFGIIFTIDEGDDWKSPAALIKANPNYGISVEPSYLQDLQKQAEYSPRKQGVFKTKHLNVWVNARNAYFNVQRWMDCRDTSLSLDKLVGRRCVSAFDLSSKRDLTCEGHLFLPTEDEPHYVWIARHFLPEAAVFEDGAKEHYRAWKTEGFLSTTEGDIVDYDTIEQTILSDYHMLGPEAVGYDGWGATQMALNLKANGVPVVQLLQNVRTFSDPMKTLEALIMARKIRHNGDPIMTWMMSNVLAKEDANGNVFPRRANETTKIDGAVCLLMAMALALAQAPSEKSYYETNDLVFA